MSLILKAKNGLPMRGGDIIRDFRGTDWTFLYLTNGPVSHGKIVVKQIEGIKVGHEGAIREFFPLVFPDVFIVGEAGHG
jgi:hypothetical protein